MTSTNGGDGRRLSSVLVAVGLAGCTLGAPIEPVGPHLAAIAPRRPVAERPVLGVGHFADLRPEHARAGLRPRLRFHWWGVSRRGTEQVADRAFAGDLAQAARRDAAATLVRSGVFSRVVWVDANASSAAERARLPDVDWVLVGELEELRGLQHREFELNVGRVGWIRRSAEAPVGRATVRFRLFDSTGERLDLRVSEEHESPLRTPAGAALDALAAVSEHAATGLHRELDPRPADRTARLRVLDGCGLGRERSRTLVETVSEVFEREAGLALVAEREAWIPFASSPLEPGDLEQALEALGHRSPPRGGLLLGLLPVSDQGDTRRGLARPLARRAVVGCLPGGKVRPLTVAHEIGHLLGAVHVEDRASIMNPRADFEARFFDPLNLRVLEITSAWPIGDALPEDARTRLERIYRDARALEPLVDPTDLDAALTALRSPVAAPPAEPWTGAAGARRR